MQIAANQNYYTMFKKITLFFCLIAVFLSKAQDVEFTKCLSPQAIEYQNHLTPGYSEHVEYIFSQAKQWYNTHGRKKNTYTIPVVVHVVYNTAGQNLHDSVIFNQIENLNKDFNRQNDDAGNLRPFFNPIVGPANIEFQLAMVDPDGNPTSGIIRTETTKTTFGNLAAFLGDFTELEKVKSTADGGSSPWNQNEYLNIWICNMSVNLLGNETTALLGYATPPDGLPHWPAGTIDGLSDGVVIQFQCFGSNNPNPLPNPDGSGDILEVLGRTVTHEVGHYLGLRHIWGDGGCTAEDGVDDTPNATGQSNFDCDDTKNTCVDDIPELGGDAPDMIENFMDYSAESCQNAFTLGQIGIMVSVLEIFRPDLGDGNPLSLKEKEISYSIYPNPFSDEFTIEIEHGQVEMVVLLTLDGKEVYASNLSQNQMNIDTRLLNSGVYIVKLISDSNIVSTHKIIKI